MTRKEYMRALEEQLGFLGEEQREALLEYYGEMIDDRMEDGMDEASAVAAMESPAAIAAQQRADAPKPEAEGEPMTDEAMKFSSLAGDILKATEKILNQASETSSFPKTAEESFRHEAERIRKKQEELRQKEEAARQKAEDARQEAEKNRREAKEAPNNDTDFGDYRQMTFACPADSLRAVRLSCGEKPIQVTAVPGSEVTLIYYTCDDDPYIAEAADGVLTLRRQEAAGRGAGRFSFSILGGVIRLGWKIPCPPVELRVPADALLDLDVRTSNSSIKVTGPRALCAVTLKTSNSRIALEDMRCLTLEAVNSNARLTLERVEAKQGLNGKTSNGRIEAAGAVCGGDMILTTSNGRIEANGCSARGEMRLTTSNSRIQFSGIDAPAVALRTSNSDITGVLPGRQTDWQIDSGTSNGRSSLPARQPGEKPLQAHTSNGRIDVRFEG